MRANPWISSNLLSFAREIHYGKLNSSYWLLAWVNTTCCRYNLQRPFWEFHFLNLPLNCTDNKNLVCFISTDNIFLIFGSKTHKLSRPSWADFTKGKVKLGLFRKLDLFCLVSRIIFVVTVRTMSLSSLNISIARKRNFSLWIETNSFFSTNPLQIAFLLL